MNALDKLREWDACREAIDWVAAQPDQSPAALWSTCPRGDWLLWVLEHSGVDCRDIDYACAERARQSALRALPPSAERDALAACLPIVDTATARAAASAAWATARASWAAASASSSSWASAAWAAAEAAEYAAIANIVRARFPSPPEVAP